MRREFRILSALEGTAVPHPHPVVLCDDHDVLGCTFYVMDRVEGVAALPIPVALDDDAGRAELSYAMVESLAELHDVDWQAAGLADLGHPEGFHERQVERWGKQLASYEGRPLLGIDGVMAWLEVHRPSSFAPSIMHGDYHMMNVLVAANRPGRVVAIVDWETATIGDPLLDLAGFCEIWCSFAREGFPARELLVERYAAARGLEVGDLTYYEALYNFRMAVLLEGIYQRSLRDPTRPVQDVVGDRALVNLARAVDLTATAT
jgi:aminoglycoside phosphotransferase (APT) family kinase protein